MIKMEAFQKKGFQDEESWKSFSSILIIIDRKKLLLSKSNKDV